jgi:GNAT superfamily N-acetyltransferase
MDIRQGTVKDAGSIAELIASFHGEIADRPDGVGAEHYFESVSIEAERQYLESDRYLFLIAEREGDLLGFIALRDSSHVLHLFVHKAFQRQGVATRLWESAKARVLGSASNGEFTVNSSLSAVGFHPE